MAWTCPPFNGQRTEIRLSPEQLMPHALKGGDISALAELTLCCGW